MAERRNKLRQEWLVERQRSMIRRAANEGLSNLVHFALTLDEVEEVNPEQLAAGTNEEDVPLATACLAGHVDVAKDLVERCNAPVNCTATVHVDGITMREASPLWCAAVKGNLQLVQYLVEKGAKVNDSTEIGSTPLRSAVFKSHVPVVKFLVQHGADVNSTNAMGHSVLMNSSNVEITQILLDNGADVNYVVPPKENPKCLGTTALHECAYIGNKDVAKLLIQRGAKINRDGKGNTPVLIAATNGHLDLVEVLVEMSDCSRDDKANALELAGTECINSGEPDTEKCFSLWKRAMEARYMPGRPVVRKQEEERKIPAYRNAVEVKTMADLIKLQTTQDLDELRVQAFLIRERVLGPEHGETIFLIRRICGYLLDEGKVTWAVELLFHALSNLANAPPYHGEKVAVFCAAVETFVIMHDTNDHNDKLRFVDIMEVFDLCFEEIKRGEKQAAETQDEKFTDLRQEMMKATLHLIILGVAAQNKAGEQEKRRFSQVVRCLVQMKLRAKDGATLLHMACASETEKLYLDYDGCAFPSSDAVGALLNAGIDVHARNGAGQTALQVARAETEADVSDVLEMLLEAGAR